MQDSYGKIAVAEFVKLLNHTSTAILMLDYDGTLAPFETERHKAYPYSGVISILDRIIRSGKTKVFIVSGRPAREIESLLDPLTDIEIWGAHGLELLRADGTYHSTTIESGTLEALARAEEWLRKSGLSHMAEVKPGGLAVHWRGLPASDIEHVEVRVRERWGECAGKSGLKLLDFDGGIELRATRPDKGDAVAEILKGTDVLTPAAFLGDDFTDEDAFHVMNGRGLSVLVRSEYRKTKAKAWLRPPYELIDFLQQWSRALSEQRMFHHYLSEG
jgi:trehalose 6-phosphate phosphatase